MPRLLSREEGRLPEEMPCFVGRRHATTAVKRLLSASRLVTLTGVPGVGKSRLALHVAQEVQRAFPDGVWLVELDDVQDPSLVGQAVVVVLNLVDQSMRVPETVLADYLADKRLLLVLDNCDHLLDACGHLVAVLLPTAPAVRVLATSREPFGVIGEHVWVVPPMSVSTANQPSPTGARTKAPSHRLEALTLFETRAAAVRPGFALNGANETVVSRLCQRLDGLPLAIELAAVQMRELSAERVLARIEDRCQLLTTGTGLACPRHQTLRAAMDWSFELCTDAERTLWARLSVFPGEFDMDAAEGVCAGDGLTPEEVLPGVAGLVGKSILTKQEYGPLSRYRMLYTIHQYGRERLTATGDENTLRHRHRDYYLHLAEQADADSGGPLQAEWIQRLHVERANLWAALDYCMTAPGEARTGLRMAGALWFFWIVGGFVGDGRQWLDRALTLDAQPSHERARALWINGWIAHLQGDAATSLALLHECHDLAQRLADETMLTYAIQFIGATEMWHNNVPRALPLLDQALARHRESNQWTAPALLIFALRAQAAGLLGAVDAAMDLLGECQAICARLGERWALSWTEWVISVTWWMAGNPRKVSDHVRASLRKKHELNDQFGIPCCIELLARLAVSDREPRRAAILVGAAEKMWKPIGRPLFGSEILLDWRDDAKARCRATLGAAAFEAAYQRGARLTQEDVIAYALGETAPPTTAAAPQTSAPMLTKREQEVARLVARGMTNKDVASTLVVSQRTAESHIEHILGKLGFTSRAQIAAWAAEQRET